MAGRRVIVTRPEPDASLFADELRSIGFSPLVVPTMTLEARSFEIPDLTDIGALVVTSGNAVEALSRLPSTFKGLPVWAVGAATSTKVRELGFSLGDAVTVEAPATAADLIEQVSEAYDPARGALLWLSGTDIRVDLEEALLPHGITLHRRVVYEAVAASYLSEQAIQNLRTTPGAAVTLFSARTAECFVDLLDRHGLLLCAAEWDAICLSPAIAETLRRVTDARQPGKPVADKPLDWQSIRSAERPTKESLLQLLAYPGTV